MRGLVPFLTGLVVAVAGVAPFGAAPAQAAASTESMTHWSCDRAAKAQVSVTWLSRRTARITWRLTDMRQDGRAPTMRIVGLDHNGSQPSIRRNLFSGDGLAYVTRGSGASRTGSALFRPGLRRLDEVEVWVWTTRNRRMSVCGFDVVKRLNDKRFSPARTAPASYEASRALRERVVAAAWKQYRQGYHETGVNCSKYTDAFYTPKVCMAWCANFAWWVWKAAGVPQATVYNSSYTDDFQDEWRVQFKPTGGRWKPARGDVIVWSHRTDGINGHVGVVVATDGWRVKIIQGNWSDRVTLSGWIDPFTSRQDGGNKRVIGFASPA